MNSLLINYYELIKIDPPRVQNSDIFAFCLSWLLPLLSGPHANRPQALPNCLLLKYNVSWWSAKRWRSGFLLKMLWQGRFCQQLTIVFLISQGKMVLFSQNSERTHSSPRQNFFLFWAKPYNSWFCPLLEGLSDLGVDFQLSKEITGLFPESHFHPFS